MKRIGLGAALLVALFVTQAGAVNYIAPRLDYEDLKFRTHAAAIIGTETTNHGVDVLGGFVDSSLASGLGVASTASPFDTTTGISTLKWFNATNAGNTIALADTNRIWAQIQFYDSGALTPASGTAYDSLYVMTQASYDGKTWFSLATFLNGTAGTTISRLDQTNAAGTFFGVLNANGASGGTPSFVWTYKYRVPVAAKNDQQALWRYPFLRWIINHHVAVNYSLKARVHFTTTEAE